ncbi:MAG TPA: HlyD family efflux transporter periplasmic adaptor subunit [Blastocatellia bacterium]|nr:HlyD family efflux transporter periplasmic adaptor subunit [Blastocatellia bacterium]
MDIKRKSSARKKAIRRSIYGVLTLAIVVVITLGLRKLKPAAQSVDGATLWPGTVERGDMLRDVRGLGTLVPEDMQWIASVTDARIDKIVLRPGAVVKPDSIIVEMSNPDLQQALLDAELLVKQAQAAYDDLKVSLESQRLTQKALLARTQSDSDSATLDAETNTELHKDGLVSDITKKKADIAAANLKNQTEIEKQRLEISVQSTEAQLAAQKAKIEQLQEEYDLKKRQVDQLHVRAGMNGVLTEEPIEVGAHVTPGANLARVADPSKLKAELKIAETQAKDILFGQTASIDTRNGVIPGHVIRVDAAAQNGTVTVDCSLDLDGGPLPKGARPDLSVEGTIELERLHDILYVQRPVHGQENSTVGLFKYVDDGKGAVRVQVKLGRASVNTIEVLDGLKQGDKVICSDTSAFDNSDRIRITS